MVGLVGCGTPAAAPSQSQDAHLKVLGILFGQCMSSAGGKAPATQQVFVDFLATQQENWDKFAPSAEAFLTKSQDGKEIEVLFGKAVQSPPDGGLPWVAYQPQPDGMFRVVNARGYVKLVDQQEFSQLFPAVQ